MEFSGNLFFAGSAPPARPCRSLAPSRVAEAVAPNPGALEFFAWLFEQLGLDVTQYRPTPLLRRFPACLRFLRARDGAEARKRLEEHPGMVPKTLTVALLGVTRFHRDEAVFGTLAQRVLPELLAKAPRIRIWSAACSEGPELYSVAMVLEEAGRLTRAELLGTDCRPDAIRRAAAGVYPADLLQPLDPERKARHFVCVGAGEVQMSGRLRAAISWRVADLFAGPVRGPWDLVLWRNMSIYLTPVAAGRLWRAIGQEVRPGGYIVTGKADHPPSELGWRRVAGCVYQRPAEDVRRA